MNVHPPDSTAPLPPDHEPFLAHVLASSISGLYVYHSATGRHEYINERYTALTGWTWGDVAAWSPEDYLERIHPDDRNRVRAQRDSFHAAAGDGPLELEFRFRTCSGAYIWCEAREVPLSGHAGVEAQRIMGSFVDVTRRACAMEDRLRESEERFRTAFDQAAVGLAHVAPDGAWLRVNQKLCDILGYSQEELTLLRFQDVTHPDDLDEDLANVSRMLRRGIPAYALEKRYIRRDKSVVWVNLTVSLLWKPDGTPHHFVAAVENIDARKQIEEQLDLVLRDLQRSNAELENYAYVASHDLRAPLTAVESLAVWLEEDLAGSLSEQAAEHLMLIRNRIRRMKALLDDLLEYSRAGNNLGEARDVDLSRLVEDAAMMLREQKKLILRAPALPSIRTKAAPLELIIRNLIANAAKHHDRDTCNLSVSVEERDDTYLFSFCDDGPGIPPECRGRVFGMFQTLRPRDQVEASGMGLALVKKLVERYHGEVWIDSNAPRGTAVRFTWPKAGPSR